MNIKPNTIPSLVSIILRLTEMHGEQRADEMLSYAMARYKQYYPVQIALQEKCLCPEDH